MEKVFRPEFLNRVDDIIVFRGLTEKDLKQIVDMELAKVAKRLKEKGLTLDVTDEAKEFLIEKGTNTDYGARPLRRAIENLLEDPLSEDLLRGTFVGADTIMVRADGCRERGRQAGHGRDQGRAEATGGGAGRGAGRPRQVAMRNFSAILEGRPRKGRPFVDFVFPR